MASWLIRMVPSSGKSIGDDRLGHIISALLAAAITANRLNAF
jgi:hypothetical protein